MYIVQVVQVPLFDFEAFITSENNSRLRMVLEALPAEKLITTPERER